ncbi:hypothetical protein JQ621_02290 [Bradyrhizobium manausense]|uniref:hypothetical protein n=1 Tax=Bradyrhizobium manausense TaxID=989370 RepID=UPI001BA4A082|nr:hypothetical protein [Bradyrhizobium manausense]MBR1086300.1 hypothetical protein [Bradyrhizobium manausense]
MRARDIAKCRKQLRENIFRRSARVFLDEETERLGHALQASHFAFAPLFIGFRVRGNDHVRSPVRQTKMMKIATTTAPASIQY